MEKVICLNCSKTVEVINVEGFYRCECGTVNSRSAMIDMFRLKHNKKSDNIKKLEIAIKKY